MKFYKFQKLEKANEDVHETARVKQDEIDMLKSTCDRLSAASTKKETELQNMSDRLQQMEHQVLLHCNSLCLMVYG